MAEASETPKEVGGGDAKEDTSNEKVEQKEEVTKEAPKEEPENSNASSSTESPKKDDQLEAKIIRQVEYYFGDANLRRDKFLLEQIKKDEEGWVPFSVLLTFKRLSALSTDIEVIANALLKSDEGLIDISEDKTKIRRHPEKPIPEFNEEQRKEVASRTAYAKGFPLDVEMSDLIEYFAPFEKVVNINMRKYLDKPSKTYKFKGSVFITFAKKEQCETFINKEKVQYKDVELTRKWQDQYFEDKKKEDRGSKKKSKQNKEEEKFDLPKGAVLHFEGCEDNIKREDIREALEKLVPEVATEIAFIDYTKGDKAGHIRLNTEKSAQPLLDKLEDKKLKVNDTVELVFRTLAEEEESEFLKKAVQHMKSRRNHSNRNKGNRKRRGDRGDEEPAVKQRA